MIINGLEKWQGALSKWDKWVDAINKTRDDIQYYIETKKYPELQQIASSAKWSFRIETLKDGVSVKRIDLDENRESVILTELYDIASCQGSRFISTEMSIGKSLYLHDTFLNFWTKLVLGYSSNDVEMNPLGELSKTITLRSKIEDDRLVNMVSWYHDEYELVEVIERLKTIKWPFDEQYVRSYKSVRGPREQKERKDIESILCCILRYKYNRSFKEIADKFDWSTYDDSQGKPMSNTLLKRLKRGRFLIREYEIPITLPTRN